MKKIILLILVNLFLFTACKNANIEFPDYDYSAVYFSYQYPVRTVVLGEDIFDNSRDNDHKVAVFATIAGVYNNDKKVSIDIEVDNSLCDNLYLEDEVTPITPLPSTYYSLLGDKIILDNEMLGGVEVSLTDAFFADPLALKNYYVLPLKMTNVSNADSILQGTPKPGVTSPIRTKASDWDVVPKDYVLYAVKYINPYHAFYLRRGSDVITVSGNSITNVRHQQYVENDEVCSTSTTGYLSNDLPIRIKYNDGAADQILDCTLTLTFDESANCTISSSTPNVTVTGNGKFVEKGEKNSWGNQDRSALYLEYNLDYNGVMQTVTKDTLVLRNRGTMIEELRPIYK